MCSKRLNACKRLLQPDNTPIVNIRGASEKRYAKGYDYVGFTIRADWVKFKGKSEVVPSTFVSTKSKKSILEKLKACEIHKRRKPLTEIDKELNPVIRGMINYFHKYEDGTHY